MAGILEMLKAIDPKEIEADIKQCLLETPNRFERFGSGMWRLKQF